MKNICDPAKNHAHESSTAFLQKKFILVSFKGTQFYRIVANFYFFVEFVISLSNTIYNIQHKDYIWRFFLLIYLNSLITLLFIVDYIIKFLPNGNIFIFMHLIFIDFLKKCTPSNQPDLSNHHADLSNLHELYHPFFHDHAGNLPADNYAYDYSHSVNMT